MPKLFKTKINRCLIILAILSLICGVQPVSAATIIGSNIFTTGNLTINGALRFTSGAVANYILTTDASGNATWVSVGSALGNATSDNLPQGATNLYYTDTAVDARINAQKGLANGLATLDVTGKIPVSQVPVITISNTFVVNSQAAMLALVAETGDVAVRTDLSKTYILAGTDPTNITHWQELLTPTDTVLSVNGLTGTVTLTTDNVPQGAINKYESTTVDGNGIELTGTQISLELDGATLSKSAAGLKVSSIGSAEITDGSITFADWNQNGCANNEIPKWNGAAWACAADLTGGTATLQSAYNNGATITTSGSTPIAFTLTSGNFNVSGAGSVNLTPTGASQFTSSGALTLTAGATSTWSTITGGLNITSASSLALQGGAASTFSTTAGNITLQPAGTGATASLQIGAGGGGSATPDILALDVKSNAGDPAGFNGAMYYNANTNKFRCYENASWKDCDTTGGTTTLQSAYNNGATITTVGAADIAFTLTSGNLNVTGAGAVNLTPTAASQFTSAGALTLTAGAASIWKTTAGNLTVDSAATLNLGTTDATAISIGKAATTATVNGVLAIPNYIDFNTSSNPAYAEGLLFYDTTEKALSFYNDESDITLNIGQENYVRVRNETGSQINNGQIVYINGVYAGNSTPTVALAKADAVNTAEALGMATHDIPNNSFGYITAFGLVHDIDTSSYSPGDRLYLSAATAGGLTTTRPAQPNSTTPIGFIIKSDAVTGIALISMADRYINGYNIGDIPFANGTGDLIADNANLFWNDANNRLGIGDNTPTASLVVGSGDLFQVFGANGNVTTTGDITLSTGGGSLTSTGGGLTLNGGGASSFATTSGNLTLQPAGTGTTANLQIGAGGGGSITPDLLGIDVKSDAGDPAGFNGAMYYNANASKFRCYEGGGWKDCDTTGGTTTLQSAYNSGAAITTAGNTPIAFTLTSGNFNVSGAGAVNLTPTGASQFTSSGALTLTAGAASTWSTSSGALTITSAAGATWGTAAGDLKLQAAGAGTTANVQIGVGGAGSITPDILGLDIKSDAGDPAGFNGAMYYNGSANKFRCYESGAWKDCDSGLSHTLQEVYNTGATITTAGTTPIAITLTSGNFNVSGAGAVNLTPTSASQFTSSGALTLTAGAGSTWSTSAGALTITSAAGATWSTAAGNLTLQAGSGTVSLGTSTNLTAAGALTIDSNTTSALNFGTGANAKTITIGNATGATNVNILAGTGNITLGTSDTTGTLLVLDTKTNAGDPAGANGGIYYNSNAAKFRCYQGGAWTDCIGAGGLPSGTVTNSTLRWSGAAWVEDTAVLITSTGSMQLGADGNDGQLVIYSEQGGTDYNVTFNPNAAMTQSTTYTLPPDDGTSGQVLISDGNGALTWSSTPTLTNYGQTSYGEMYEDNITGTTITITTANTYYGWYSATQGTERGSGYVTFTDNAGPTADTLDIGVNGAGKYLVQFSTAISINQNNRTVKVAIFKNAAEQTNIKYVTVSASAGQRTMASMMGILNLINGDTISLRLTSSTNGDTLTVYNANITISRIE